MKIDVVVFDVKQMLMSLFEDKKLNQYNNLVVNSCNRFEKYEPDDNRFGEVISGIWYNCSMPPYKEVCQPVDP